MSNLIRRRDVISAHRTFRLLFLTCLFFAALPSQAEEVKPGSLNYLDHNNGFRDVKFGSSVKALAVRTKCNTYEKMITELSVSPLDNGEISKKEITECIESKDIKPLFDQKILSISYFFIKINYMK